MRITKLDIMKIYKALHKRMQMLERTDAYDNVEEEQKLKLMLQGIYCTLLALTDDPLETFWLCEDQEKSDDIFSTFFEREN